MFAVIDIETTGILPKQDRVVEVAVVLLDSTGQIEREYVTLVNPQRDVGPVYVHHIHAADARQAPTFDLIAGDLIELLRGRIPVAHNLSFDAAGLGEEFSRLNPEFSAVEELLGSGLCTMRLSRRFLPGSGRKLSECCASAGLSVQPSHGSLADARAAAALLEVYLGKGFDPELELIMAGPKLDHLRWPELPALATSTSQRSTMLDLTRAAVGAVESAPSPSPANPGPAPEVPEGAVEFDETAMGRWVDFMPRIESPVQAEDYLDIVDSVVADREVTLQEQELLRLQSLMLGLDAIQIADLHRDYLRALIQIAWSDGVLTAQEVHDLKLVAQLLQVADVELDAMLHESTQRLELGPMLALQAGDKVAITGDWPQPRADVIALAERAGFVTQDFVSRDVRALFAADENSLSGKACKARGYGIPIFGIDTFMELCAKSLRNG